MSDLTEREVALFTGARRLAGPARTAYLDETCAGDAALRRKLDDLLSMDEAAGGFLEKSALGDPGAVALPGGTIQLTPSLCEKPGDRIGPYKLLQQIGEGGCGVVYMAEQEAPIRRRVALKVIKLGMDTKQVVARFEAERQALALMDHPNIAKVLDAGATETGRPYFVMELVQGIKITEFCDRNLLTTRQRLDLFIQVCQAIQHAHQKGVIHRDIKPSNILVTINDGVPVPKVIDFGIAKATQGRLTDQTLFTAFGQFMGTPAYMSPEQAVMTGMDVDTRSDIYSLGVLLYELLSGGTPFDTKDLVALGVDAMRKTIREKEPVRPSTRLAMLKGEELTTTAQRRSCDLPKLIHLLKGDLDWIVMKTLEKDRNRRYETVNGLAMDLKRFLGNEPVLARPPGRLYRFQKLVRRNKLVFAAGGAVAVALIAGLGLSTWAFLLERKAHDAELAQRRTADEQRQRAEAAARTAQQERNRADAEKSEADRLLYVADMNLAQPAWEQNNLGRLRQLLEETQDSLYRGFEWYHWQRLTHLAFKTLRGHLEAVNSAAISPDGQRIVTGSDDETAMVWDATSGKRLLHLKGHRAAVNSAAFSPDGQRIVTGSDDNTAKVWEAASGRELLTLRGHLSQINSARFSPDGQWIVTGSYDLTAKVWDAASGRELLTLRGHKLGISSVAFSPDGQRIVTGSFDGTAKVWEAASGRELRTLTGHKLGISSVAFSPDGQRILTGSYDHTAAEWEAVNGKKLLTLDGHGTPIWCVAFSSDGQHILTGSYDHTISEWEAASGKEVLRLKGHSDAISSVAFFPGGQRIVSGSSDHTAKVWDAVGARQVLILDGHKAQIYAVAFSPDGRRIVTGSEDHTAKVWETASGRELLTLAGHSAAIWSVAFSPDGQRIVTGSSDHSAIVWDAATGRPVFPLHGHKNLIMSVAFSPDGQRIVTGSWDQTAKVWDAASGRELCTLKGHSDAIWSVAFSPDGQRILTGSEDHTAKVWETASGQERLTFTRHTGSVRSVAFSPDGDWIVTGSFDETAKVWEAASGRELRTLNGHGGVLFSVAFSPDGQRILTGSGGNAAKLWEAASGQELLTLKGHTAPIRSVAFSPDGQRIVAGSEDHVALVWEASGAGQVAAWQKEEQSAAQDLAVQQRERTAEKERQRMARDRDSIKRWLVLAPIALPSGQSGAEALDLEQIEGEGRLRPKAGEAGSFAGTELNWRPLVLEHYIIDFNEILGQVTEHSVAYAVCYLHSEAQRSGLQMLVGSDDEAKIYLNGKQIYRFPLSRGFLGEQDAVPDITLNAGLNVLVFKVVNEENGWEGSIRFTDAQGHPVQGISFTLDPESKDHP